MSFFPTIITKGILGRNVALISFVGMTTTVVARGGMGATEWSVLTLGEECDDLVDAIDGG